MYQATCDAEEKKLNSAQYPTNTKINRIDIDERIYLTKPVEVPAFGSVIAQGHTESAMMMGHRLRVMTQVPYPDDDANLPVGLYVLRTPSCTMAAGRCTVPKYRATVDYTLRLRASWNLPRCMANSNTCKAVANNYPGSATVNSYPGTMST